MFDLQPPRHIPTLPIASFWLCADDFRSTPMNRHSQCPPACLKGANRRLMHRSKQHLYSIISPAMESTFRRGTPFGLTRSAENRYAKLADKPTRLSEGCPSTRRHTAIRSLQRAA